MAQNPLDAALAMRGLIRELRRETEDNRRLAKPIVARLVKTGLARMALPKAEGGLATPAVEALRVYETLATAEASVPWILFNNALVCLLSRFANKTMRSEIFGDPASLYAQSTRPSGKAAIESGGFRIDGQWALVSGCELAEWLLLLCVVEAEGSPRIGSDGTPETVFVFVHRSEIEILDTWDVGGLRGTGSHDVAVRGVSVNRDRVVIPGPHPVGAEPVGRVPIICNVAAAFSAIALGVAQATLDEIVAMANADPALGERAATQFGVASQSAALHAARRALFERVEAVWDDAVADASPHPGRIGDIYGAVAHANDVALETVTSMFALAGTRGLYADRPFERAQRDLQAMLRHVIAQPFWVEDAGKVRLGLTPESPLYAL